jgi:hypothetical protein
MEIDRPDTLAEVTAAFQACERALMGNDPVALIGFFRAHAKTVRHGIAETLRGIAEIAAFRRAQAAAGGARPRRRDRTVITTFWRDFATAGTTGRHDDGRMGRQMQTWARLPEGWLPEGWRPEGWRIVAAHVSLLAEAG